MLSGGTLTGGSGTWGGNLYFNSNYTYTLNGIHLGSSVQLSDGTNCSGGSASKGGNVYVAAGRTLVITDDTVIENGTATGEGGGNIYVVGTLQMTGGVVQNGTALRGGNIYEENGTVSLSGGEIKGGRATGSDGQAGGNIYIAGGTMEISDDVTVKDGVAEKRDGGNIALLSTGALDITGGTVSGGKARRGGGNIVSLGTLSISGGEILNGTAEIYFGGNLWVNGETTTLSGDALIKGGRALGGKLDDGTYIQSLTGNGGNISVYSDTAQNTTPLFIMDGGTVKDGIASPVSAYKENGVYKTTGTTSGGNGGNIHVGSNGTVEINGGKVENGIAGNGGNVSVTGSNAVLTVTDGSFLGGKADTEVYKVNSSKTEGGETTLSTGNGANFFIGNANVSISGGTFTQGEVLNLSVDPVKENSDCVYISAKSVIEGGNFYRVASRSSADPACLRGGKFVLKPEMNVLGKTGVSGRSYMIKELDETETAEGMELCYEVLEGDSIAQIGDVEYASLSDAFSAAKSGTLIQMIADHEESESKTVPAGITLDLNGCDLTIPALVVLGTFSDTGLQKGSLVMDDPEHLVFGDGSKTTELPVYKSGVYQLYSPEITNDETETSNSLFKTNAAKNVHATKALYAFRPTGETEWTPVFEGSKLTVTLDFSGESYLTGDLTFVYGADLYSQFIDHQEGYFTLRINGGIQKIDVLNATPRFEAKDCNAKIKGATKNALMTDYASTSEEIALLENQYAGRTVIQGEMHDHSDSGGTSDGHLALAQWKEECEKQDIQFATILDHKQVLHMYDPAWDSDFFIGGSEAGSPDPRSGHVGIDGNKLHYNMVFAEPEGLKNVLAEFTEFKYTGGDDGHFGYVSFTRSRFMELSQCIRDNGGFLVMPHPSSTSSHYLKEDTGECFYYGDYNGIEVLYYKAGTAATEKNYSYWKELLSNGRRVYCCAGGDGHRNPSVDALTTLYVSERNAAGILEKQRNGDSTAGMIGIRMAIGDTCTGGHKAFLAGEKLVLGIGDFHSSLSKTDLYQVKIYKNETLIAELPIDTEKMNYFTLPVDTGADYYRAVVYDVTSDKILAYGNPIWNDKD